MSMLKSHVLQVKMAMVFSWEPALRMTSKLTGEGDEDYEKVPKTLVFFTYNSDF